MSYKTILVHADATEQAATRIALAAQLALAHDAHLVGIAVTGVSRYLYQEGGCSTTRPVPPWCLPRGMPIWSYSASRIPPRPARPPAATSRPGFCSAAPGRCSSFRTPDSKRLQAAGIPALVIPQAAFAS
jgi:hypothetical protein